METVKTCANCGNMERRGERWASGDWHADAKYVCVNEKEVDKRHVCDGWVKKVISDREFSHAVDRALERMSQPGWELGEVKLMKNYREAVRSEE